MKGEKETPRIVHILEEKTVNFSPSPLQLFQRTVLGHGRENP